MTKSTYKLAILGGMGPLATSELYKRIVGSTPASNDSEHINTIILSHASLPDRTETIINNKADVFLSAIKSDFDLLNTIKPEKIAIPCNTSHYFYDEFIKMTDIKIINMVEETIKEAKKTHDKAYIFLTEGTYKAKIYEKYAEKYELEILYISDKDKKFVMELIYEIKSKGIPESFEFERLVEKYTSSKALGIIACTELSLITLRPAIKNNTLDALDVLCRHCII